MMFKKEEGFTLVELMVVVLIIGILIAVAIPVFNSASASARRRTCQANQRTFEGAVEQYLSADPANVVPADYAAATGVLVPNYVKVAPVCKEASATYSWTSATKDLVCSFGGTHNTAN